MNIKTADQQTLFSSLTASLVLIISFSLVACGGGSGSGSGGGDSGDASDSGLISEYFSLSENAFDQYLSHSRKPDDNAPDGILKVFDGNGDGYPDLYHTAIYNINGMSANGESFVTINYYENDGTGRFQNKTIQKFGSQDTDVAARRVKFFDINNDGIEDIFLASNREDGRLISGGNANSTNHVYISQADTTFKKFEVGTPAWTHDIVIGDFDNDGIVEFVDGNFTPGNRVYDVNPDGTWTDTTVDVTNVDAFNAANMIMHDFNGDGCLDAFSTTPWPRHQNKSLYFGDCFGMFVLEQEFNLGFGTFDVPGIAWNGDPTIFTVVEINGQWLAGISNAWSLAADLDNDGDLDILYETDGILVNEEDKNNNFIDNSDSIEEELHTQIVLLRNTPTGFERVNTPIADYPSKLPLFWATLVDLNGNGYLDLVIDNHAIGQNSLDLNDAIFLNKGNGEFEKLGISIAEGEIIDLYRRAIPLDANQDGIMDFVLRDFRPVGNDEPFRLLLGKQNLPDPIP